MDGKRIPKQTWNDQINNNGRPNASFQRSISLNDGTGKSREEWYLGRAQQSTHNFGKDLCFPVHGDTNELRLLALPPVHKKESLKMPKGIPYTDEDKGKPIVVTGGKYAGYEGWMHKNCKQPKKMVNVILKGKDDSELEASRCIQKKSIEEVVAVAEPRNFHEALLKEHTDIAADMQKLAAKLASVQGYSPNTEIFGYLWKMWQQKKELHDSMSVAEVRVVTSWQGTANQSNVTTRHVQQQHNTGGVTQSNDQPHVILDGWDNDIGMQ